MHTAIESRTFRSLVMACADAYGDLPFLSEPDGNGLRRISYRDFSDRVLTRAAAVKECAWSRPAIILDNSIDCITELTACVIAGCQSIVLSPMVSNEELSIALAYSDADHLFHDPAWFSDTRAAELSSLLRAPSRDSRTADGSEGDLLFFTSGTTETAKAVILSPHALLSSGYQCAAHFIEHGPHDRQLIVLPLSHIFGFTASLITCQMLGIDNYLCPNPKRIVRDLRSVRPTILLAVPTVFNVLVGANLLNSEITTVFAGGSQCRQEVVDAMRAKGIKVFCGYGLTETSAVISCCTESSPASVMMPWDSEISILADGEIAVRNDRLMKGYYKSPEATAKVFTEDGFFLTGDTGVIDADGMLHLTGKKKDMLVLESGEKVFCPEWEMRLCGLLGTEDLALDLRDGRVVLYICDSADRLDGFRSAVAEFNRTKPMDCRISDIIITETPLPRTATGKIRRWALKNIKR